MCIYGKIFIALCAVGTIAGGGFLVYKKVKKTQQKRMILRKKIKETMKVMMTKITKLM